MTGKVRGRVKQALIENRASIGCICHHAKTTWSIAKAALLELLLEGKVEGMKTTKSWVFWIERNRNSHMETENIATQS